MSNLASAPIILTGNQRSSTTFLATLLKKHPDGSFGTEDGVIRLAIIWFYYLKNNAQFIRYNRFNEFIQALKIRTKPHHKENAKIMRSLLRSMYEDGSLAKLIQKKDASLFIQTITYKFYKLKFGGKDMLFWGDKYPEYVMMLDQIHKIYPKTKYLFLIRHPLTNIEAISRKTEAAKNQLSRVIYNVEDCLIQYKEWHNEWNTFKSKIPIEQYMELKFEDLLQDPKNYLSSIESFLNISIQPLPYVQNMLKRLNPEKAQYNFDQSVFKEILDLVKKHDLNDILTRYNYSI